MKDTLRELLKGYIEKAQKKLTVAEKLLQSGDKETAEVAISEAAEFVRESEAYLKKQGLRD